ncbi:dual specificity protein phosphatase family protein [Psychromarinibacter halotolerans]|uniref:Dual specificity protein phosphatase family protein n=1 Tax=Psychromarinibacter halotolerans TaxID=1775175 RepID=A0ABV7GX32_9RHOB|nr:dual specificity protein phosphatase [Psychromarinibacter halotolerans]MDF0598513.1 dual specificity protein phosphatase [Psychromarinibacter halotolerans]
MNDASPMKKAPRYDRPDISLIEERLEPYGVALYIGGREGMSNPDLLQKHGITTVVNCAVNLDVNLVTSPDPEMSDDGLTYGFGAYRYYKLGLVDGGGNAETMMLAGYYQLLGALSQILPERASYPLRERGNVLVNCRGGRSRSVALVALLLHKQMPDRYPTLDAALDHVRTRRELHPDEWFEAPKPVLVNAAKAASDWIDRIAHRDPEPAEAARAQ